MTPLYRKQLEVVTIVILTGVVSFTAGMICYDHGIMISKSAVDSIPKLAIDPVACAALSCAAQIHRCEKDLGGEAVISYVEHKNEEGLIDGDSHVLECEKRVVLP